MKLRTEIERLKKDSVKVLAQRCKRQQETVSRKRSEIHDLKEEVKRLKSEFKLPGDFTPADTILLEMLRRRNVHHSEAYSTIMREFAFNVHYISPKGYAFLREKLPNILPDKSNCSRWTKHVKVAPGLIPISLNEVKRSSLKKSIYYSLSFDEMAIRQQFLYDGTDMVGKCDFGALTNEKPPQTLAKSALMCLATEINGSKSFPIAYILTDGLKSNVLADIMSSCIEAIQSSSGNVVSVSFDGLRSNFTAVESLGANLAIEDNAFQPYFIHDKIPTRKHFIFPDPCHMFKLIRNTFDKCKVLFNAEGKAIRWSYIQNLLAVQEKEQLRAGNKLTSRHVNFHQKKMNVKLCVQVLSEGTASGIDFCRSIDLSGFEGSEATTEFLRVNNYTFDLLNSKPFMDGNRAPLSMWNKLRWNDMISSSIEYYKSLQVVKGNDLVPLYSTKYGTCVKGIVTALTSVRFILEEMELGELKLTHLPTYRLSQDPLELFFGTLRRRLGCNDNPNVTQLAYSLRAILSFKLSVCKTGNCNPQEDLFAALPNHVTGDEETCNPEEIQSREYDYFEEGIEIESFMKLSLFVENVSVYIAGFVGKKLVKTLDCSDCAMSLNAAGDDANYFLRDDFHLIVQKDRGGLFKPSEDLVLVCKLIERLIRVEESNGILKMNSKKIDILLRRECVDRRVFQQLHPQFNSTIMKKASQITHALHRSALISEICKAYLKVRLNYLAHRKSLQFKPVSNRSKCNKIIHFSGC